MISIIAAVADNGVIGKDNDLPWRLPRDLKRFKEITRGHAVIMGRKTYESIIKRLGKPLPDRTNIIITRQKDYRAPGCMVLSLDEAIEQYAESPDETFVIGGAELYTTTLSHAQKLYLTHVHAKPEGDTVFPAFNKDEWQMTEKEFIAHHDSDEVDLTFAIYERRK